MFYDLFGTIVTLEVERGNLPAGPRILQWSILMFTLKILADKKVIT